MKFFYTLTFWFGVAVFACGIASAGIVQLLSALDILAPMSRDLASSTGFPLDGAPTLDWPWGGILGILVGAGAAWIAIDLRAVWLSLLILVAACVLCLTGSWVVDLRGGALPSLPLIITMLAGYSLGQMASGFLGDVLSRDWYAALSGAISPRRMKAALADVTAESEEGSGVRECIVALIEPDSDDVRFLETLRDGLQEAGAWARIHATDGRLCVAFGLVGEAVAPERAVAALARAAEAVALRGRGRVRFSLASGITRMRLVRGSKPHLELRGEAWPWAAMVLEETDPRENAIVDWVLPEDEDLEPPDGWETISEEDVQRWIPSGLRRKKTVHPDEEAKAEPKTRTKDAESPAASKKDKAPEKSSGRSDS